MERSPCTGSQAALPAAPDYFSLVCMGPATFPARLQKTAYSLIPCCSLCALGRALRPCDVAAMMLYYKGKHRVFINTDSDQRNKIEFNNVDPHRAVRLLTGPAFSSHTLFGEGNSWISIRTHLLHLPSSNQAPVFIIWKPQFSSWFLNAIGGQHFILLGIRESIPSVTEKFP